MGNLVLEVGFSLGLTMVQFVLTRSTAWRVGGLSQNIENYCKIMEIIQNWGKVSKTIAKY